MVWTNANNLLADAFRGSSLFGSELVMTIILVVFTMLLITRKISLWGKLSLPVSLLYVAIIKTTHDIYSGVFIILISAVIFTINAITPALPKTIRTKVFRQPLKDITGITRKKELYSLKELEKGMSAPKNLDEVNYELKRMGSRKERKTLIPLADKRKLDEQTKKLVKGVNPIHSSQYTDEYFVRKTKETTSKNTQKTKKVRKKKINLTAKQIQDNMIKIYNEEEKRKYLESKKK